jgi:acetylglutamate/LysW-gamma-L-alpha-aminoadipate kinase
MTLVVKIGGSTGTLSEELIRELAYESRAGQQIVLIHGGSALTDTLSERLGHPIRKITSPSGMTSRYTDSETVQILAMAVAGQINTALVSLLQQQGVNALGLSGVDGRLLVAKRKAALRSKDADGRVHLIRDDYTGQIVQVNSQLLKQLLEAQYMPVIAPLALSTEGERLNVDGDRAAAAIAVALGAEKLVIMTNVPGLLRDVDDPNSVIQTLTASQINEYIHHTQGGMKKKLLGAQEALAGGVACVHIGNGSVLSTLKEEGTTIIAGPSMNTDSYQMNEAAIMTSKDTRNTSL